MSKIRKSTWTILSTGLSPYASYPTRGAVSHPRLLFKMPEEARKAVVAAWEDPREPVAEVYTFQNEETDPPEFIVIKRRMERSMVRRELCYPGNIGHIVQACRRQAQEYLGYSAWQWIKNGASGDEKANYVISLPFGIAFAIFAVFFYRMSLGDELAPDSRMIAIAMYRALLVMSAVFAAYPFLTTWWEWCKLRRALRPSPPAA